MNALVIFWVVLSLLEPLEGPLAERPNASGRMGSRDAGDRTAQT